MKRETVLSLAGFVRAADSELPLNNVRIDLIAGPPRFERLQTLRRQQHGAAWRRMPQRMDRTRTRQDGSFYFVDLPPGLYRLRATAPDIVYQSAEAADVQVVAPDAPDDEQPQPLTLLLERKPDL